MSSCAVLVTRMYMTLSIPLDEVVHALKQLVQTYYAHTAAVTTQMTDSSAACMLRAASHKQTGHTAYQCSSDQSSYNLYHHR
jgi:hypothetical protein